MVVRCAASDPDLYPGQPARVATWELEASGGLTVEVGWGAVGFGCPRQIRNHHTLTPVWEPWGSPPFNYPQVSTVKDPENFEKLIYNRFNLL